MRRIVMALMAGGLSLEAVPAEPAGGSGGQAVSALEARVSDSLRLELEEARETGAWAEQSARLEALAALRREERKRIETALGQAQARARAAREARDQAVRARDEAAADLTRSAEAAAEAGRRLLSIYDGLPEPLRERMSSGARFLRERLKKPVTGESASECLRGVAAFGYDMQRLLADVLAGKQLVQTEGGKRMEADVLYLGGAMGYYLAPDRRQAGLLVRTGQGWTAEARDELAERIALALRVKNKETPPALVCLPLSAPVVPEVKAP